MKKAFDDGRAADAAKCGAVIEARARPASAARRMVAPRPFLLAVDDAQQPARFDWSYGTAMPLRGRHIIQERDEPSMAGMRQLTGSLSACALALALCLSPATAAPVAKARHAATRVPRVTFEPSKGFGSFTPAAADPKLAAAFARSGLGTRNFMGGAFRFTPSSGNKRRAITVAVRARSVTRAEAARMLAMSTDAVPSAYSLGVSVGWKRFALSGDLARVSGGLLNENHEAADIGLSFSGRRFSTKLDLAADRNIERPLVGIDQSWSVGLGGTYALTHSIDLSGGIRYKAQRDQFQSLLDNRRDSQAVYLGTTFRF